jgi:hypothetical protein
VKIVGLFYAMTDERFSFLWLRVPKVVNSRRRSIGIGGLLRKQCLIVLVHLFALELRGVHKNGGAAYWPPVARIPAFKMEVAAAKMRAALWLGISFSVFSQCWM